MREMTPERFGQKFGNAYLNNDFYTEDTQAVKDAYAHIAAVNERLYEKIPVDVIWCHNDPYEDYQDMNSRVQEENVLYVFAGGGKPDHMTKEQNVKGRAVHDWFGHLKNNVDFSITGEFQKWDNMRHYYNDTAQDLLFTEVVGQRCAVSVTHDFAEVPQRGFLAPQSWIDTAFEVLD